MTSQRSAVAFIVFNRPEHTSASFARIRAHRPDRLFLIADGPRTGNATDEIRCAEVREIVAAVDWPCHVTRIYSDENLGCRRRVSSGLHQVFASVDRAVILEDDCLPGPDFFRFCDDLLERYADQPQVAAVSGDNFDPCTRSDRSSYYFSKYVHVWGWATWSRAWASYEDDMAFWPSWRHSKDFMQLHPDRDEREYWTRIFDRVYAGEVDTWDYVFVASSWYHGRLSATPRRNLVENIGFGPDGTHTLSAADAPDTSVLPLGSLVHPASVRRDAVSDRAVFEAHYRGAASGLARRAVSALRRRWRHR